MTGPYAIDFVTVGGTRTGMGHFMRCATLAREAANRGWAVRSFIEGDPGILEHWSRLTGLEDVAHWSDWAPRTKSTAKTNVSHAAVRPMVALDYPERKSAWLDRVKAASLRTLVIDDPEYSSKADWTLLPALHHGSDSHETATPPNGCAAGGILAGPRYTVLSAAHRRQKMEPRQDRRRLLLSMGGADPHNLTEQLAPVIRKALEPILNESGALDCEVVLGPAYPDPELRVANQLTASGWTVHSAVPETEMARLMSGARLAIIGFGTSLSELAYHRTPFLTVTHHPHDRTPARDLEARGIGRVLGTAGHLDLGSVLRRVRRSVTDSRWQSESAERAYRLIDGGRGAGRVLEAMEGRLPSSTAASDSNDSSNPSNQRRARSTPFRVA